MATAAPVEDPIDALISSRGLRRTKLVGAVLSYLMAHADTSFTHAQLHRAVQRDESSIFDRGTLYRVVDRLAKAGLLVCRIDAQSIRRYQSVPGSPHASPHFECHSCHRNRSLAGALELNAKALQKAARAALDALLAMGCQDVSLDLAVRGVCADCASAVAG